MRNIFILVFSGLISICVCAQKTQNVIIVVIDGARFTETFGDTTHQFVPKIWNELKPQGTLFTQFYNNGTTKTNSGHSTILTGTWQSIANDGSELPHKPTIFEYYRKQTGMPQDSCYVVLGKDKLSMLRCSDHPDHGAAYQAAVDTSVEPYNDAVTVQNIKNMITAHHPRLLIANMAQVDAAGHSGVWNDYTTAIKQADSLVCVLWNFIQADPIYANNTTLIITNDHGRHSDGVSDGFKGHGDSCEGCRHIMLLVLGPDTPADVTDISTLQQIDIAPTVGSLMHFDTPLAQGIVISSLIQYTHSDVPRSEKAHFSIYPNPFTQSTQMCFYNDSRGLVNMSVYDMHGRLVSTPVNMQADKGAYIVSWDSNKLASGTYTCVYTVGSKSETKGMIKQ